VAVSGGNGNGLIDFNECNSLRVTLQNLGCSKETGISAVLSSSTSGVTIEQPNSPYPDASAPGSVANQVFFDVSTAPGLVCGTPIDFSLTVASASGSHVITVQPARVHVPDHHRSIGVGDLIWTGTRVLFNGVVSNCATRRPAPERPPSSLAGTTSTRSRTERDVDLLQREPDLRMRRQPLRGDLPGGLQPRKNVCQNFLATPEDLRRQCELGFRIPAGQSFDLVLHEIVQGTGCASYSATVSGLFDGGGKCLPCAVSCPGPATIVAVNAPGQCGAAVELSGRLSSGSCGVVTSDPPSGSFFLVVHRRCTSSTPAGCHKCAGRRQTITHNDAGTRPSGWNGHADPGRLTAGPFPRR